MDIQWDTSLINNADIVGIVTNGDISSRGFEVVQGLNFFLVITGSTFSVQLLSRRAGVIVDRDQNARRYVPLTHCSTSRVHHI
jgi:hypothetical protein